MKKVHTSKVTPKIRQLATMATELREEASFNITRLTTLKSLCEDSTAATRFALHFAQLTYRKMQEKRCPAHLDPEKWEYYKQVVDEAIRRNTAKVALSTLFTRIEQSWRLYSSVKFVGLCIARSSSVPETCNHSQGEFSAITIRQMERYVEQPTPQ